MPFIQDNLYYHPIKNSHVRVYQSDKDKYDASRVKVLLPKDILPDVEYVPFNQAEGYGRLRLMEEGDRPSPFDVVIYKTLPNDLPRVAGTITTVPQTPLSHVNLRAIQNSIPNAFIRDALTTDAITSLLGSYVYYAVSANGYTIRAATKAEVDKHFESLRPQNSQTLQRDLSVTAITEGGSASFTIPTGGSYTLAVATTGDSQDEADGSVTITVNSGNGYTVSATAGSGTVSVADDDNPPPATPEISIAAGSGITEGGNATFTITANPAPTTNLDVTVSVSQSGDYGVTTGSQTVTIPTAESYTLTVATINDSQDEADGSVTVTVNSGNGYTASSSNGAATVSVADDDDPPPPSSGPPTLSLSDASATEGDGTGLQFTVSLSGSASETIKILYWSRSVTADMRHDFEMMFRDLTFSPGETTKAIVVPVVDDHRVEGTETMRLGMMITGGKTTNGRAVIEATGTIIDND